MSTAVVRNTNIKQQYINLAECNDLDETQKKLFRKEISKVKDSIIAELRYYFGWF